MTELSGRFPVTAGTHPNAPILDSLERRARAPYPPQGRRSRIARMEPATRYRYHVLWTPHADACAYDRIGDEASDQLRWAVEDLQERHPLDREWLMHGRPLRWVVAPDRP